MPEWVGDAYQDYAQRLPNQLLQLTELPLGQRPKGGDTHKALVEEGARMLKAIPSQARVIALDPRGRSLSTEDLAQELSSWMQEGRDVALLVGGPDGLAPECLARAEAKWSLSRLTFPHMLVRVIVAEQVYRAWTILQHHPYHR